MLDRKVVGEFLDEELKEVEIPKDIFKEVLVKTFCKYAEDDYYEWLKDNFKSFFNYGNPDWQWVRERIKKCEEMIKDRNWTKTLTYIIKEIVEGTIRERLNLWRVPTLKIIKYNLLKRG